LFDEGFAKIVFQFAKMIIDKKEYKPAT